MAFDPTTATLSTEGIQGKFDPTQATEYRVEIPKSIKFTQKTGGEEYFRMLAPSAQEKLITAGEEYYKKTGKPLQINSAFRGEDEQKRLYDESVKAGRPGRTSTGMPIAQPGTSQHMGGFAIDIQQGKGDKVASEILGKHGFMQPHSNDPVHFEFNYQPGQIKEPTVPLTPNQVELQKQVIKEQQLANVEKRPLTAGVAGITQGTFAGLGQYPAALMLQGMTKLAPAPGGQPLSYEQALQQVRESQQSLREENPYVYGTGVVGGSVAGLGKAGKVIGLGSNPVQRMAGMAGVYGGTSAYTSSPEATVPESIEQAGIGAGATVLTGGAFRAAEKVFGKIGESAIRNKISDLVKANTPESLATLQSIFGAGYKRAMEKIAGQQPTLESVTSGLRTQPGSDVRASTAISELGKKTLEWQQKNPILETGLPGYAGRYAEAPAKVREFATNVTTAEQKLTELGARLKDLTQQAKNKNLDPKEVSGLRQEIAKAKEAKAHWEAQKEIATGIKTEFNKELGTGLAQVAIPGGLGAAGGAAYGLYSGEDPYKYALGAGGAMAAGGPALRWLATRAYMNPNLSTRLERLPTTVSPGAYSLTELFRNK